MSHKATIKVVKRKDVEETIHTTSPQSETADSKVTSSFENGVKAERKSRREIVNTVSNWVTERRERNRVEEIQALRKIFGNTIPLLTEA